MVSIIIVNFSVEYELFSCIQTIIDSKPRNLYEIIVVDNDKKKHIYKKIHKKFPQVIYIPNENRGFGQANNLGTEHAKGEYLFFLNPDTRLLNNVIDLLINYLNGHGEVAIAAPLLYDAENKPYNLQGSQQLTPLRDIFTFSFVSKLFPRSTIIKRYWLKEWDKKSVKEVAVVPGTAFVIRKKVFKELNGFDENFFLYFEEHDLCKRTIEEGWEIILLPSARVFHAWGKSTAKSDKNIQEIFDTSKFYYFSKHFGMLSAFLVSILINVNKYSICLLGIIILGVFLLTYKLYDNASFIGDQGWFYLSARDMILTGQIPLVGIASSHPWLHQGALWTYLLAGALFLGKFHPLSGFYLSIGIGLLTTVCVYVVTKKICDTPTALIASALFASSPEIVKAMQFSYHTVPIPLLSILFFYCTYKISKGVEMYIPVAVGVLALLYQFELFTVIEVILLTISILFAIKTKRFVNTPILKISVISLIVGMAGLFPILLYDLRHGFVQTGGFILWIGYSLLKAMHIFPGTSSSVSFGTLFIFIVNAIQRIVFYPSGIIALGIFLASLGIVFIEMKKKTNTSFIYLLLLVWIVLPMSGILLTKTPSSAYLPLVYPAICLLIAVGIKHISINKFAKILFILIFVVVNSYVVLYQLPKETHSEKFSLQKRIEIAQFITNKANGREIQLVGKGKGSEFASYTMNYEYLIWWLGGHVSHTSTPLQFIITENSTGISVSQSTP